MVRQISVTEQLRRKNARKKWSLKGRMVSEGMRVRYSRSVLAFLHFTQEFGYKVPTWDELDDTVSEWLEHIFHDGQRKSLASDGLAGLQYHMPQSMGRLRRSWKLVKVWQKLEPPRRVLPISPLVIGAFAGVACELGYLAEASAMLVGFDAMLRSGELYRLKIKDIKFYGQRAVLSLGFTKTGKRANATEMVVVESKLAVSLLRQACHNRDRNDYLLHRGERCFRAVFNLLIEFFDIQGLVTVYSLRRGGASWDFLEHQSLERILLRGRWSSTSSARIYSQDATAMVIHLELTPSQTSMARAAAPRLVSSLTALPGRVT